MNLKGILNFIDSRISIGFDVKPLEAINYFKNKGLKTTFSYTDMLAADHVNNFTIAKMMDMDLLQDMQDSLLQAQKKGWTLQQWKDRMIPHLQANGWWGRQAVVDPITGKTIIAELGSSRRLDVIFRTNIQQAYMAGQWQQIKEQERIAPYLMYNAVDDYRTREEHRAWDNKIYPVSHPFWITHMPLNGWNCRCTVIQFSKSDLEDLGYEVSEDIKEEYREWKNPRTGLIEKIPKGVDGGFNVNAGQARFEQLQKLAKEKAHAIKDKALREAAEEALVKIEMQAKALGDGGIIGGSKNSVSKMDTLNTNTQRQVSTGGLRNEKPLTLEQKQEAMDYAVKLGVPKEAIHVSDSMNTSYKIIFGEELLYIGTDVLPVLNSKKANSKMGMFAALAHEVTGHRAAELAGKTNPDYTLEEVQASIRAARYAPDLLLTERILLLRDAIERLQSVGLKIRDVKHLLWLDEDN